MKQKITLVAVFIFLAIINAFGQKKERKSNGKLWKFKVESQFDTSKQDDVDSKQSFQLRNNIFSSQNHIFINQKPVMFKSIQEYKKRLDSTIYEVLNQDFLMVNEEKYEYTYDTENNLTGFIDLYWNDSIKEWIKWHKEDYAYDENGLLTLNIWYDCYDCIDSTNQWENQYKHEYTNNADGSLASRLNYVWRENTSLWDLSSKYEYTYDENGDLTLVLGFNWQSTNEWRKSSQEVYTYDDNENLLLMTRSSWSSSSDQWVNMTKEEYLYDDNLTKFITSFWDSSTDHWDPYDKIDYSYDEFGKLIQHIDSDWDENINQWVFYSRDEYFFDGESNFTSATFAYWDEDNNVWDLITKADYIYDFAYPFTDILLPYFYLEGIYDFMFSYMLTISNGFFLDPNSNQWINGYNQTFFYSDMISGVSDIYNQSLTTYPNPADEYIAFEVNESLQPVVVMIFDINGKQVMNQELAANNQISISHLNSGMYFYRVDQNKKSYTGKFIVK